MHWKHSQYNRVEGKKANNPLPTIQIKTKVLKNNRAGIQIADNRPGMNQEVKNRLFHPFFTTRSVGKETVLGLAISYQILVEKHGGTLNCFSQPGEGTEFRIEIFLQEI